MRSQRGHRDLQFGGDLGGVAAVEQQREHADLGTGQPVKPRQRVQIAASARHVDRQQHRGPREVGAEPGGIRERRKVQPPGQVGTARHDCGDGLAADQGSREGDIEAVARRAGKTADPALTNDQADVQRGMCTAAAGDQRPVRRQHDERLADRVEQTLEHGRALTQPGTKWRDRGGGRSGGGFRHGDFVGRPA